MSVELNPDEYDIMRDEAYDEAMDSLTQAERNKLLRSVARPTQPRGKHEVEVEQPKGPGFIRTMIGLGFELTGTVVESIGRAMVWIGAAMRRWGYGMRVG